MTASTEVNRILSGEQAHIVAESETGPRGRSILTTHERNSYFNLILLCPTHHREIDANDTDYPVEKLNLIKQAHEIWVLEALENEENTQKSLGPAPDRIADFIREWLSFADFFFIFFSEIDMAIRYPEKESWWSETHLMKVREWHRRRAILRELLYLTGEEALILQDVPNWQRLRKQEQYIEEGNYQTPFSFMLDFLNPIAMINLHGSAVWSALHISSEFVEILSWQYPNIQALLRRGRTA